MPKYVVVMPAYNAEKCIKRSIESVLSQKLNNFELYIVNDGSTDSTAKIVKEFNDCRIHLINTENGGVSKARNLAIANSVSDYICFLDADDEWYPDHLNVLDESVTAFPDNYFFATASVTELKNGNLQSSLPQPIGNNPNYYDDYFAFERKYGYVFNTNCVCLKRDALEQFGVFEEGVSISEDIDLWYRILVHTGFVFIPRNTNIRHRDFSRATKHRNTEPITIFWTRVPALLECGNLPPSIRNSLVLSYENQKITEVRCYILNGNKKAAYCRLKSIRKKNVPVRRYIITWISLLVPSKIIRLFVNYRDRNYFYPEEDSI